MADKPITTEEFHSKLVDLVADMAAKAIRGDTGGYEGVDWADADRVQKLVFSAISFTPFVWVTEDGDISIELSPRDGDGTFVDGPDGFVTPEVTIGATVLREAQGRLDEPSGHKEGVDDGFTHAAKFRDALRSIADSVDEWLTAHPSSSPEPC